MARKRDSTDSPIERFIELVDEALPREAAEELRRELDGDPILKAEFEQYRRIVAGEKRVQSVTGEPSAGFLEQVMTNVRNEPDEGLKLTQWEMVVMQYKRRGMGLAIGIAKGLVRGVATGGTLFLTLLVLKMYLPAPRNKWLNTSTMSASWDETERLPQRQQGQGAVRPVEKFSNPPSFYEERSTRALDRLEGLAGAPSTDSAHPIVAQPNTPYRQPITQPFQLTTTAPHSTFSMDVDTGSYTNVRKVLRSGRRPSADLVRAEEFINYFSYQHPTNTQKPFSTVYDIAPSPMTKGAKILRIGVKSRESIASDKPWNLVFLIDTSGSMADNNKLPMVKQALKLLAGKMRASDRLSIVTYANGSQVALPPTSSGELDRINSVIDGLTASGGTNGHAGITLAYEAAQQGFIANGINRVILATDGDFNVGITNQEELISEIQRQRLKNISLTTIGVGEANYKEQLMEQLADKGDGNYFYLDTFDEARKVFDHDLVSTIETVAKDAKIQVEFNPAAVSEYRLIGYQNRALAAHQFTDNSVDAGEVGAGQSVTALYEVVLAGEQITPGGGAVETRYGPTPAPSPTPGPRPEELGFVRIRFQDPTSKEVEQLSFTMMTEQVQSSLAESSESLRFATAVAAFAEKLRGAAISATYAEIADLAQGARGSDPDGRRAEFIALVREAGAMP